MFNIKDRLYIATFQNKAVETAARYGVGLEYNHTCISESLDPKNRPLLLAEMRRDFEASGSGRALLHGPFTEIYPAAIDYRARQMAKKRLNESFDVCRDLGVKNMVVHNGWLPFIYFKEWQSENGALFWQDFMADKPEDFSRYIENVLEDEPYMMKDMMSRITDDRIKICLDTGHANAMTSEDISVEKWIEVLSPYIGHFHLHNNYGDKDSHNDFDSGSLDMTSVLTAIENCCPPNVTFTIEAFECLSCMEWLSLRGYI